MKRIEIKDIRGIKDLMALNDDNPLAPFLYAFKRSLNNRRDLKTVYIISQMKPGKELLLKSISLEALRLVVIKE